MTRKPDPSSPTPPKDYAEQYSEPAYWDKLKRYATQAGQEVIEKSLWLYYAAQKPETPKWAKATIYGALAYFVSPIDALPDITPIIGYSDDISVILAAVGTLSMYIDDKVKKQAQKKMKDWFGLGNTAAPSKPRTRSDT